VRDPQINDSGSSQESVRFEPDLRASSDRFVQAEVSSVILVTTATRDTPAPEPPELSGMGNQEREHGCSAMQEETVSKYVRGTFVFTFGCDVCISLVCSCWG
jgi:hypothetical protein